MRERFFGQTRSATTGWVFVERVSDTAVSAVMGHFDISAQTRRQLFDAGSPTTDRCKTTKLSPVLEVADVLEREWWPSIQPFTSVKLSSDVVQLMRTDAH